MKSCVFVTELKGLLDYWTNNPCKTARVKLTLCNLICTTCMFVLNWMNFLWRIFIKVHANCYHLTFELTLIHKTELKMWNISKVTRNTYPETVTYYIFIYTVTVSGWGWPKNVAVLIHLIYTKALEAQISQSQNKQY